MQKYKDLLVYLRTKLITILIVVGIFYLSGFFVGQKIVNKKHDYIDDNILALIFGVVGLILILFSIILDYFLNNRKIHDIKYDNKTIFRTPFHKEYWRLSFKGINKVRDVAFLAILVAMITISHKIIMPSGFASLSIGLTYLFLAIVCIMYGPIIAIFIGIYSDIVGFYISPQGSFNFLYTINSILACFTYAIFFYRTKISFFKVLLARLFINLFVNAFLGSIWYSLMVGNSWAQTKIYMFTIAYPKNIAYLVPQSIVLFLVLKAVSPILYSNKFISQEVLDNILIF